MNGHIPPVSKGQVLENIKTSGMSKEDPFLKYEGFMIFIKHVPEHMRQERFNIRIVSVKERYAFAEYLEKRSL